MNRPLLAVLAAAALAVSPSAWAAHKTPPAKAASAPAHHHRRHHAAAPAGAGKTHKHAVKTAAADKAGRHAASHHRRHHATAVAADAGPPHRRAKLCQEVKMHHRTVQHCR